MSFGIRGGDIAGLMSLCMKHISSIIRVATGDCLIDPVCFVRLAYHSRVYWRIKGAIRSCPLPLVSACVIAAWHHFGTPENSIVHMPGNAVCRHVIKLSGRPGSAPDPEGELRGPAVEHWSLADVLSLSCT